MLNRDEWYFIVEPAGIQFCDYCLRGFSENFARAAKTEKPQWLIADNFAVTQ